MKGRLIDLTFSIDGKQRITIEIDREFTEQFNNLKDTAVRVEIKKYREGRSLNANAYFHVLVNKIAQVQNLGNDEVKKRLAVEYGALAKDDNGETIGFKLPTSVNVDQIYPYTKIFDVREENGVTFNCYLVYKRTRTLDSKEMSRLIDGTIYEAKEMGIETAPPWEIERYLNEWNKK